MKKQTNRTDCNHQYSEEVEGRISEDQKESRDHMRKLCSAGWCTSIAVIPQGKWCPPEQEIPKGGWRKNR